MDFSALNILITVCSIEEAYFKKSFSYLVCRAPATASNEELFQFFRFLTTNNSIKLSGLYSQVDFSALNIFITVCSIAVV